MDNWQTGEQENGKKGRRMQNAECKIKNGKLKMKKNGFTLLEILVVMVIIGILATIGLRSFQSTQMKGRDSSRKSNLRNIATALEAYMNDKGEYPASQDGNILGCGTGAIEACTWGEIWQEEFDGSVDNTIYMQLLPLDPKNVPGYYYVSEDPYQSYLLYAHLENEQDPSINALDSGINCNVGECNFVISSTNYNIN